MDTILVGRCPCGRPYRLSRAYANQIASEGRRFISGKCVACSELLSVIHAPDGSWTLRHHRRGVVRCRA